MKKENWVWQPHPAHFIMSNYCRFRLSTYVGGYIVSTVGELWPERGSREIHAKIVDPKWYLENIHLKGDYFDSAYFKRFGYEMIGMDRLYETMVFEAQKSKNKCCPWEVANLTEIDFDGYNTANDAYRGHLALCKKWSKKS